ncbi:MAG: MBL fold metallo-hydrolase [Ramlibacter sp.]|nr:MBL fold metallo-hydrolase [Ramlibacter sp.]
MRTFKKVLIGLLFLLALAAAGLAWLLQQHPSLMPYSALGWRGTEPVTPSLKVSFLGVATLLLDDGETALLTDGFFSRPSKMKVVLGKVEPDLQAITRGMLRAGIPGRTGRLAAVIPLHSHYDHVMDSPEVARRTGALLLGSASSANVGRGWGLPESQIRVPPLGVPLRFGRFTLTFYPGRHAPTGFTGGEITAPLKPPVRVRAYQEGMSYILLVEHGGHRMLIAGSAGFEPGALKGVQADVVMLGIGALGSRDEAYRDALWRELVSGVGAKRVIPIHWDDFWVPSEQPMQPMPPPLDHFEVTMEFLRDRGAREGVDVRLPLQWQPMDVWTGLSK